jgi:methylglutamate dehydrogenase subunit B
MRIRCQFCGEREVTEFTCFGAALAGRPDPAGSASETECFDRVYLRDNPCGPNVELWYHAFGCRGWLRVTRDTRTHEILAIVLARGDEIA